MVTATSTKLFKTSLADALEKKKTERAIVQHALILIRNYLNNQGAVTGKVNINTKYKKIQ
ncbi:hypothetical protein [Lacticaseibacillus paracasei]|uniref:hypothetical protein n=1 Tax=Lacticaseibacillus paracasei TaxID=1597 RepID=UPI0034E8D501